MSISASFQAFPSRTQEPQIWELADKEGADSIMYAIGAIRDGRTHRYDDADGTALLKVANTLIQKYPQLEKRYYYLGTDWGILHYLLSASQRRPYPATYPYKPWQDPVTEDHLWMDIAIEGYSRRNPPENYIPPEDVELIALVLAPMTIEDLRQHWIVENFETTMIYKFSGVHSNEPTHYEERWPDVCQSFLSFRTVYLGAAANKEGMLVYYA